MKTMTITRIAAAILGCGALPAAAATLTFDSLSVAAYQNTFTAGGWTFSAATAGPGAVNLAVEQAGLQSTYSGDRVVSFGVPFVAGSEITSVSIGTDDGSEFKLEKLSLGDIFGNSKLRLQAYRDGSPLAYTPVDVDIFATVSNVTFSGWDNLDEIRVTNFAGSPDLNFDIDDLEFSTAVVPESSSVLLLGLAALGVFRRRRD
ncbi:MAG: PEP-CTERM sorting domain-containing protein [Verrucomicrobiota bacterium]